MPRRRKRTKKRHSGKNPGYGNQKERSHEYARRIIQSDDALETLANDIAENVLENTSKQILFDRKLFSSMIKKTMEEPDVIVKLYDDIEDAVDEDDLQCDKNLLINEIIRSENFQKALKKSLREELE